MAADYPPIDELFRKYLDNRCDAQELDALLTYFGLDADSPELRRLVDEALRNEAFSPAEAMEIDRVIQRNERTILALPDGGAQPATVRPMRRWLPVAAAVAMLLAVGWLLVDSRKSSVESLAATEILPGGNRATLTLADGRVIDLSSAQEGIVVGTENITYTDGSTLAAVMVSEVEPSLQNRSDSSTPLRSAQNDGLTMLSLTTPKGGQYQITLADGSKVWLNSGSTLRYPSRFLEGSRDVFLEGEAFFDITAIQGTPKAFGTPATSLKSSAGASKADAGARVSRVPFKVRTSGQEVVVLGTQFNISAYADDPETKTTLVEGKVRVRVEGVGARFTAPDNLGVTLSPGEQSTTRGAATTINTVDVSQYTAWKSGLFDFTDQSLETVMKQLARWYDIEVEYEGDVPQMEFYGKIYRNKNLSEVLELLKSAQIRFRIEAGRKLIITKN